MGILDELKATRAQVEGARSAEQRLNEEREHRYRREIRPRLLRAYEFLRELIEHIDAIGMDIQAGYELPVVGRVEAYRQSGLRITVDSSDKLGLISLQGECQRDQDPEFQVETEAQRNQLADYLREHGLSFADRTLYDGTRRRIGYAFRVQAQVPLLIDLRLDRASEEIHFETFNFSALGARSLKLVPEQFDERFLERLGRFLLRQDEQIWALGIDEADRAALRQQLAAHYQEKRREDILARQYQPIDRRPGRNRSWFERLFRGTGTKHEQD